VPYKHSADYLILAPDAVLDPLLRVSERLDFALHAIHDAVPEPECVYDLVPQRVYALAHRMAIRTPFDLYRDRPMRAQLPFCSYVFVTYQRPPRAHDRTMFPEDYLGGLVDTVFRVYMTPEPGSDEVAALLRFRDASVPPTGIGSPPGVGVDIQDPASPGRTGSEP
jgi:hypothetical protein